MVFIDTHIAVWLYNNSMEKFSSEGRNALEINDIFISPACALELEYLYEIGKINRRSGAILELLADLIGLGIDDISFAELVKSATNEKWTRDPFDRMIVAHAKKRGAILITADRVIKKNYKKTVL